MKLRRRKIPSAILTADWHIRADTPECRTDDFLQAQEDKVKFIVSYAKKYDCPILIAGDIGHRHQWPNWLLRWFIEITKGTHIIAIPGQHDLPGHRLDNITKSAQGVLSITDVIDLRTKVFLKTEVEVRTIALSGDIKFRDTSFNILSFPYSKPLMPIKNVPTTEELCNNYPNIAITHQMIIKDKLLWPGQVAPKGSRILKKYPEYDLILSGDNHHPFVVKYKKQLLVNPGSIMRTTADQADHKPRIYLWYAKNNKVNPIFLPIEKGVVSRDHIDQKEEIDERRKVYVKRMKTNYEIGFSYEENLKKHIKKNKTDKKVEERIWEMVD